jgi:ATP:ADP antiporter, AAA family
MSERPSSAGAPTGAGFLYALARRVIAVEPEEVPALAWAWLYIFAVLSSYYIMRPIREQMAVAGGVNNIQWLFTATLAGLLLLNVPFAYLVKTLPRSRFIPITYRFFAANILVFALVLHFSDAAHSVWIGRAFFVWISIFNLFVVSVFWSLVVDVFNAGQGKRLFGFIAAAATIGAICGSGVTATLARHVPTELLLIGAALLLEVAVLGVRGLSRLSAALHARPGEQGEKPVGGNLLAGITHPFKSAYLANISLFILLFAVTSTFLYFQQAVLVRDNFHDRASQTAFFAQIDLAVNVLTLVVQLFFTGRILGFFGVGVTLAILPMLTLFGFGTLALLPAVSTLVVFQVLRRSGDYAIARPTREVLYTTVPREDRYKAKNFIDTVVYRAGDQIGAWTYALIALLGFGPPALAAIAMGLALLWLINAWWLGRRQDRLAHTHTQA